MGTPLTFNGRLPGVVCEAALPPAQEDPLRIDVAAFVGFAERGPLDLPVAVNDISQYREVFGNDLLLARTRQGGQPVYAALPQAVRSFFDNNGRRCYVVRVAADSARSNRFRLPGMVAWNNVDSTGEALRTVITPAAWVGRWSDAMSIGTQLQSWPLRLTHNPPNWTADELEIFLELPTQTTVQPNDLLRLHFDGAGKPLLYCSVYSAIQAGNATLSRGIPVNVTVNRNTVLAFTHNIGEPLPAPISVERQQEANTWTELEVSQLALEELPQLEDGYALHITTSDSVRKDDVLRVSCANGEVLSFPVANAQIQTNGSLPLSSPPGETSYLLISREPNWQLSPVQLERLTEGGWEVVLSAPLSPLEVRMGLNPEGILHLPSTESIQAGDLLRVTCINDQVQRTLLFPVVDVGLSDGQNGELLSPPDASPAAEPNLQVISRAVLWQVSSPPLSPPLSPPPVDIYGELLQVDLLSFDLYIREGQETQEIWSGLRFGNWINTLVPALNDLQSNASQLAPMQRTVPGLDPTRSSRLGVPLLWLSDSGHPVQSLYLPLGMGDLPGPDEFSRALPDTAAPADPRCPLPSKDGLESFDNLEQLFLDDRLTGVGVRDLMNEATAILYQNPGQVDYLRKLHSLLMIDEIGLISIPDLIQRTWTCQGLFEDTQPPPSPEPQPPSDDSQFHTCAPPSTGPGSNGHAPCAEAFVFAAAPIEIDLPDVRQQLNLLPVLDSPDGYQMDGLLAVQRALVNLCAARADALAVLSLPLHFKKREVLEWQRRFTTQDLDTQSKAFQPLESLDSAALSYAAVYHPWLQIREEVTSQLSPLRAMPPDGTICGMIAARELKRGPWIAPANVPLQGVVGLTPTFNTADWADLFNAQINLVRQPPGQFTLLSAHTLSLDNTFLQISVRRLLIFLRKLALRRGMRYVFEANNERFRQRVQASFEHTLTLMAARGALTAFEVDTSSNINTQNDYDNGRFLIALKIAPTQPIEWITVVLLRAGEGLLEVIEG